MCLGLAPCCREARQCGAGVTGGPVVSAVVLEGAQDGLQERRGRRQGPQSWLCAHTCLVS